MTNFQTRYGKLIPVEELPTQSHFENCPERLLEEMSKADSLVLFVSVLEKECQDRVKSEHIRHDLDRTSTEEFEI